jgi:hypothetical protein
MAQRGEILYLHREEAVARAVSQLSVLVLGKPIHYRLKDFNGGADPHAAHCASISPAGGAYKVKTPTADCIGLVLWSSGIDRKQPGYEGSLGEWLNCSSLLADAHGEQRFCRPLATGEAALAGDWVLTKTHIGMYLRAGLVIDCSPRHARNAGVGTGVPWSSMCQTLRPLVYTP